MTTCAAGDLLDGRYLLGDVLGSGGMAQVRRGTDTLLGRPVAVKLFRADLELGEAARAQTEMQTLAALHHPGLVAVYDAGTDYLVMELVGGPTLAACCLDGSLSPQRLAELGAGIAAALAHVHERGIVHRDVKPANILLDPSGRPKLVDFGIARIIDGARHTSTGLTVGTAPYLSPEQVTGAEVGPPADVYALGLVLLEALTGRREYTGGPVETALARLHRQPLVPASLPAPWPGLLTAMTARDPAVRPTANQVAEVLSGGPATQAMAPPAPRPGVPVAAALTQGGGAPLPQAGGGRLPQAGGGGLPQPEAAPLTQAFAMPPRPLRQPRRRPRPGLLAAGTAAVLGLVAALAVATGHRSASVTPVLPVDVAATPVAVPSPTAPPTVSPSPRVTTAAVRTSVQAPAPRHGKVRHGKNR